MEKKGTIAEQLKHLPASPGVYIFRDSAGEILYIGKASSLRNRVRSYFQSSEKLAPKTQTMVSQAHDLEFFVTGTETEAIILEYNLIQRHQPHFNIRLKDGKSYPFLKISLNEEWPRIYVTRKMEDDGGRYFGPFASAKSLKQTVKVLKGMFPFRTCSRPITGKDPRPCLNYYIHLCPGPCIGAVTRQEYSRMIKQVILFLEGKQEQVVRTLRNKMEKASESMEYEKAAVLRDQIQSIEKVIEDQKITARVKGEQDVIAFVTERDQAYVQVFFIRRGRLIGRESFVLQGASSEEPEQIMTGFVKQYYGSASYLPPLLLLQHPVEDSKVIEEWLRQKRGGAFRLEVPVKGNKKMLVDTVAENAAQALRQLKIKQYEGGERGLAAAMRELQEKLKLPELPNRMECYDISNIQGTSSVGSMVVFEKGRPKTAHYRRFKIKTIEGADDFASLREVLGRRFKRFREQSGAGDEGDGWAIKPDLVLIDGGKGQLSSAVTAMKEAGAEAIPVAGLAKENEDVFLPGQSRPVVLPADSPGSQMLQRIRDEAHRFAIGYHRDLRRKKAFKSALDGVPGIGPRRRKALIKAFGSVRGIKEATAEELATVEGITRKQAEKIKEFL
jgi:excinuclease ABC subunit C